MIQYEIKVTGRVQGVGFRYFVNKRAKQCGLKGWVKNTIDGAVLVLVQGEEKSVEIFLDYLKIGSPMSNVEKVNAVQTAISREFPQFEIRL